MRSLTRHVLQVPYQLVRVPLAVFDRQVVARVLPERSGVRQTFEQGLATLDSLAQAALVSAGGEPSTPVAAEPPSTKPTASKATTSKSAAPRPASPKAATTRPVSRIDRAEEDEIERRAGAYLERHQDDTVVGELADDEIRRAQAEVAAKQAVEDEHHQL